MNFQLFDETKRSPQKKVKSFVNITNDPDIFKKTHIVFSWILQTGGNRLQETILEGPPTEDSILDLQKQEGIKFITANLGKTFKFSFYSH